VKIDGQQKGPEGTCNSWDGATTQPKERDGRLRAGLSMHACNCQVSASEVMNFFVIHMLVHRIVPERRGTRVVSGQWKLDQFKI